MSSVENHQTQSNQEEDFLSAMRLATGSTLYMVMQVAIELGVFDIIAKAGSGAQMSPKTIVSHLHAKNPNAEDMLDRILRLLTSYSILTSSVATQDSGSVERLYGLGPVSKHFVKNEDGVSLAHAMLLIHDKVFMDSWYHLKDAILEGGIPFNKAHGMNAFEYPARDPRFNQVFNKAMFSYTTVFAKKMVETYKGFEGINELVDVGGGLGITISTITAKYPHIKGINFDLPHVVENAPSYPGVKHVGGSMFESVPKAETIFTKWVLHDWDDEHCIKMLKNCYTAMPQEGKLIIVDAIVATKVETSTSAKIVSQVDAHMMTQHIGGKERTEVEFDNLIKAAGFVRMKKVCYIYSYWVVEVYKN